MKKRLTDLLINLLAVIAALGGAVISGWSLRYFFSASTLLALEIHPFLAWFYVLALILICILFAYKSLILFAKPIATTVHRIIFGFIFGLSGGALQPLGVMLFMVVIATIIQNL